MIADAYQKDVLWMLADLKLFCARIFVLGLQISCLFTWKYYSCLQGGKGANTLTCSGI